MIKMKAVEKRMTLTRYVGGVLKVGFGALKIKDQREKEKEEKNVIDGVLVDSNAENQ